MEGNTMRNKLTYVLFIIYLVALVWIVIFKLNISLPPIKSTRSVNLVPFSKPLILNGKVDLGEMILNVLVFIPLGVYAGVLYKSWSNGKKILLFFGVSLLCELCQLILGVGVFDITDIII